MAQKILTAKERADQLAKGNAAKAAKSKVTKANIPIYPISEFPTWVDATGNTPMAKELVDAGVPTVYSQRNIVKGMEDKVYHTKDSLPTSYDRTIMKYNPEGLTAAQQAIIDKYSVDMSNKDVYNAGSDKPAEKTPEEIFNSYLKQYTDYRESQKQPFAKLAAGLAPMSEILSKSNGVGLSDVGTSGGGAMLAGMIGSFAKGWNDTEKSDAPTTKELTELATALKASTAVDPAVAAAKVAAKAKESLDKTLTNHYNVLFRAHYNRAAGLLGKFDSSKLLTMDEAVAGAYIQAQLAKEKIDPEVVADVAATMSDASLLRQWPDDWTAKTNKETRDRAQKAMADAYGEEDDAGGTPKDKRVFKDGAYYEKNAKGNYQKSANQTPPKTQ